MNWYAFDHNKTIGQLGSENGIIVRDEEHSDGARITLEWDGYAPYTITCGIYGWMVHTRFFSPIIDVQTEFENMQEELARILKCIPSKDDPEEFVKSETVGRMIRDFIERFP